VQKNQGNEGRLTKGSGWPELPRKVVVDDGRAAEVAALAEDGGAEVAGPSGLRDTVWEAPAVM
jgi:N-acyl-D-aspartate/D-glutamate deacylase